jgi:methyl coenzyme M reductase gamma subunit
MKICRNRLYIYTEMTTVNAGFIGRRVLNARGAEGEMARFSLVVNVDTECIKPTDSDFRHHSIHTCTTRLPHSKQQNDWTR